MDTKPGIKMFTIMMCISNLATLLLLDLSEPILIVPQMMIYVPLILLTFLVIYHFFRGRNWARILVIIGAFATLLLFLPGILNAGKKVLVIIYLFDAALAVWLLLFLNTEKTRNYFKGNTGASEKKMTILKKAGVFAVIGAMVVVAILVGVGALFFGLERKMRKMNIYAEDLNTGCMVRLTETGANTSPDISRRGGVVFNHRAEDTGRTSYMSIWTVFPNNVSRKKKIVSADAFNSSPSWGPDSIRIFYVSDQGGQRDLWEIDTRTGLKRRITDDPARESGAKVSPDGKLILFMQKDEKGEEAVYVIPSEGGRKKKVVGSASFLRIPKYPSWTDDSTGIIIVSFVSIVLIDLDGNMIKEIDLTGLNNLSEPIMDPEDPDTVFFKARPARSVILDFYLYKVSVSTGQLEIVRGAGMFETGYVLSHDGKRLIYSRPSS